MYKTLPNEDEEQKKARLQKEARRNIVAQSVEAINSGVKNIFIVEEDKKIIRSKKEK